MKSRLLPIFLTFACAGLARADFNPVALTQSSYTFNIVVQSNTVQSLPDCITASVGGGTGEGDSTFFERGVYARTGGGYYCGVPLHGATFIDQSNPNRQYAMPPDYTVNNGLLIDSGVTSGTLTLNSPTTATNLSLLGTGGGGGVTVNYTVNHQDGITTETGSFNPGDWFNGSNPAWICGGRVGTPGGGYSAIDITGSSAGGASGANPRMYSTSIAVSSASPVTSISFTYSSGGGHDCFFAVSCSASGGTWSPVAVSGLNEMLIEPAAVPFPITASMDNGTNINPYDASDDGGPGNTWFEQGYIRGNLSVGLPRSGSTFNSQSNPTHHYQMANYSTNNAILIDTNHQVANITPAFPTNYAAFALLTAGGNIGGNNIMTNLCILQHEDGVNETNPFYGYDWYNGNIAPAFIANGRVNMNDRSQNTINGGNPKLFESFFTVADVASPVTNIMVMFQNSALSVSATTYIMALSASAGGVAPLITSGPLPTIQAWYPTQTATFTVQITGTAPVTNSWLVKSNGVYVPLTDGVDVHGSTVSGSGSTTLTLRGLTLADATNYEFIAANSIGSVTSSPALLETKGIAGVVAMSGWNNIANATYPYNTSTNIFASDGVATATLTLSDAGVNNAYNSGITGEGANYSLMHGYIDAGDYGGFDAIATISGLTNASYDVYIYCLADQTRPAVATNGLPNYTVNGTTYYAPVLGATGASTYDATSASVGGTGFNGFVPATTFSANDFNQDISVASFGNYIKIASVAAAGGQITVQAEADTSSFRSPLNAIELVSTSSSQKFGINFLGNTTDAVGSGQPVAPIIDAQAPTTDFSALSNHISTFSVTIDASSATPVYYQWYSGATAIPGATSATYVNVDTNSATFYCIITNFVGSVTSTSVAMTLYSRPPLSTYQAAIFAYNPVSYWPLNETNGNTAFDYASTNDGTYTGNYALGDTGLPGTAGFGANTSVGFDGSTAYVNIPVNNLNITGPLTVIAWVQQTSAQANNFETAVGHSDQSYRLSSSYGQSRFADPGGDVSGPNINDGNWHQLIGVYDGTLQHLYVDGVEVGTPTTGTPSGSGDNVLIGAAPDYLGGRNWNGNIAQVAILSTALSASQVLTVYQSLDTPPTVSITPVSPSIYAGTSVTLTAHTNASITPATSLQWYYIDTSNNSNNIAGATGSTYTIANATIVQNGYTYGVNAGNAYGITTASVVLTVQNLAAFLAGDISPLNGEAYVGAPVTYSVNAQGSLPIYYQWSLNGVPVSGATNASYTAPAACGTNTIQVSFTNAQSSGIPIMSSPALLQGDAYPTNITFNTDGTGWQLNTLIFGIPTITSGVLELTDGNSSEASSAFYTVAQYVGSFTASFTYTAGGNRSADGVAFVIQNYSSGATALGGAGGGLGFLGISNSVALEINLYPGNGENPGIAPAINGNTYGNGGNQYVAPGTIDVTSGDPINFTLNWANGVMAVKVTDGANTYTTNYVLGSLTPILGGSDLGYVGFTGGDGGATSIQTISNFQFHSVIAPVALSVSPVTANSFKIIWPAADPSYVLQTTSSLKTPSWVAGPTPVVVGGVNQVTVNVTGGSGQQFYRLVRVVCQ